MLLLIRILSYLPLRVLYAIGDYFVYPLIYYVLIVLGVFLFVRTCRPLAPEKGAR